MSNNASPTGQTIYRLSEMVTEEVSLVDRAANRRKFLMVKRENEGGVAMAVGKEVTPGSDGSLTSGAATPAPAGAATPAPAATAKAAPTLTADVKEMLTAVVAEMTEGLAAVQAALESAKIVETPEEMDPTALCEGLMMVAELAEDVCYALAGVDEEEPVEGDENADPEAPPNAEQPAPLAMSVGKQFEVRRAKRVIQKHAAFKAVGTLVRKYGAKMSKDRMVRLQNAVGVLSSVLSEVAPAMTAKAKAKEDPKKKPGAVPGGPTAPNPPPGAMNAKTTKAVSPEVAELTSTVNSLAVTIQKQAQEIATMRNGRAESAQVSVEGGGKPQEDFSWPLDMADKRENAPPGARNRFGG